METEAVLITPEEFSKVCAKATSEFVKMFEEKTGNRELNTPHLLLGIALSSILMKLIFNRDENDDD